MRCLILTSIIFVTLLSFSSYADDFKVVGKARMEYLFWDIYDAQLATPSGSYIPEEHPVKLTLTYLRDFKAKAIVKATNEQWQHLGKNELVNKYDKKLLALWPNIKEGESLSFVTNEQGVGAFYHNDEMLGSIDDSQFADGFLAIWLSEQTSEPTLRTQLLGK